MNILDKIQIAIAKPDQIATLVKSGQTGSAIGYYAILLIFMVVMSTIVSVVLGLALSSVMGPFGIFGSTTGQAIFEIALMPLTYGLALVGFFIAAAILHVLLLIFGARGGIEKTIQSYAYSSTPTLLFGWVPILGWAIWVWFLVLMIITSAKVHDISMLRSVLALFVVPAIILAIIVTGIFILAFLVFGAMGGIGI
ncbi:MAG: YIP1 family protein [Candidatus Woesearchaeota archaeon]